MLIRLPSSRCSFSQKIGMRNPLHRKKLQLCLNGLCTRQTEANILDTHWVQSRSTDAFTHWSRKRLVSQRMARRHRPSAVQGVFCWFESRRSPTEQSYTGRIEEMLTPIANLPCFNVQEDIIYLNITNELHHLSIKRAIQVLRLNGFNPTCIKRRPSPDDKNDMTEIMHWSNHRVMEWLRSIDLSEYAPNLRGSGVCGAVIVSRDSCFHPCSSHSIDLISIDTWITLQCSNFGGDSLDSHVQDTLTTTPDDAFSRTDRRRFTESQKSLRKIPELPTVDSTD